MTEKNNPDWPLLLPSLKHSQVKRQSFHQHRVRSLPLFPRQNYHSSTQNTEVTSSVHLRLPVGQVTFQGIVRRSKTDKAAKACRAAILSLYRSVSSWKRSDFSPSQQAQALIHLGGKGLLHAPTSCPRGQPADRGTRQEGGPEKGT